MGEGEINSFWEEGFYLKSFQGDVSEDIQCVLLGREVVD